MFEQVQFEVALDGVAARSSDLAQPVITVAVAPAPEIPPGFAHEALPILTVAFNDRNWDVATVRDAVLNQPSCQLLITARAAEELAGFVTVHSTVNQDVGRLHWLSVVPEWQRKGIGTALILTACRTAASELKHESITLTTESYRSVAISLYRKLGFHEILKS